MTTSINAARVKIVIIVKTRVCKICAEDGEEVNKAIIFTGHVGTGHFTEPEGTHCWVLTDLKVGREPRPGRSAAWCRGPHSAAFPAPLALSAFPRHYIPLQRSRNPRPAVPLGHIGDEVEEPRGA